MHGDGEILSSSEALEKMSKAELIEYIRSQEEAGVRVTFAGKNVARKIARRVQPRICQNIASRGVGSPENQSRNAIVEGENLQAMTTLYKERGQVDLFLTDPPYNTGGDFRYNDKWDDDPNDPDLGDLVSAEDRARHTKWMKFMWPRLSLMKDMLKPNGVLAICIDYRELFRLGQMLDEMFGETNRLAIINWQKTHSPKNQETQVSTATEYVLVYAKDAENVKTGLLERSAAARGSYKNPDEDPKGPWTPSDSTLPGGPSHPGQVYAIQNPFTGQLVYPPEGRCWRNERRRMKTLLEEWGTGYEDLDLADGRRPALALKGVSDPLADEPLDDPVVAKSRKKALAIWKRGQWPELFFRRSPSGVVGEGQIRFKTHLEEVKQGVVPTTYWADDDEDFVLAEFESASWPSEQSGTTRTGMKQLEAVVGRHGFETVKPLQLFSKIITLWCPPEGLVLDPFAGSGTTGHAVLAINKAEEANRRFILIEQGRPERGDPYARSLTQNRLKRVVAGKWVNGKGDRLGGGFRFTSLQNKVDAKALLGMKRDDMTDAVIASHFDVNRRGAPALVRMSHEGHRYLVARNEDEEGFFLVWNGGKKPPVFTEKVYDAVVKEAIKAELKPVYHVYARFNVYQSDDVLFYQIPDRILMDFGLSTTSDAFNNEEDGAG